MTEVQKLKERTCKDVHSLLLSGNQAVTLRQLEKDYRDFIGSRIPFQQMGYVNLESYLRDNSSYFKLYWDGPNLMVKHVTNAETEHIEMMLSRQKPKRPKARKSSRYGYGGQRYPKPRYQPVPQPAPPRVPSILRGEIRGLLMEYTDGMLGSSFDTAYNKRFENFINFKRMGFGSLLEMLRSMPDIVRITTEPSGIYKIYPRTTSVQARSARSVNSNTADKQRDRGNERDVPPRFRQTDVSRGQQQQQPMEAEDDWEENVYDKSGINQTIQREIQNLLSKHKDGIWASRFQAEYRTEYRKDLDIRGQGYNSVINLMAGLPHLVTIDRANQRDWLLFDARLRKQGRTRIISKQTNSKKDGINTSPPGRFSTAPPIDEEMKEAIRQVVAYHPKGVLLDELTMVFQQLTGEELVPRNLGYNDVEKLAIALDDVIHMEYIKGQGKLILYPQLRETIPRQDKLRNLRPTTKLQEPGYTRREVPVDAVGPDSVFRLQEVPPSQLAENTNYVEVYVSVVVNPSHFWLQLKGHDTTDALEVLMDRLEDLYCNSASAREYALPDELVTINQLCAAVYPPDLDWHRCRITGIKDLDFVQLYYVDYGSTHALNRKNLKFLKWRDFELPAQAIPAKLSNIKPKGGEWTLEARELMLKLVSDRPLIALVTDIALDGTLSVCLTDTRGETDIHINDELVHHGLAEMDFSSAPEEYLPPPVPEGDIPDDAQELARSYSGSGNTAESECERHIKYVQLTSEYGFHVVCHDNKAYVTSGEISNLLWPGKDMLRSMMRQKKLAICKLVLPKDENPELFEECLRNDVGGTTDTDGKLKSHVTFFQLASIGEILAEFQHPSAELHAAVLEQAEAFNPQDPYWKEAESEEEDDEDCIAFGRQTLETALQSLQFKRKRILQAMQQMDSDTTHSLVEELQLVERQLQDFKNRLKTLDQLEQAEQTEDYVMKQMTDEDNMVCSVVAEQSGSYLETNNHHKTHSPVDTTQKLPLLNAAPRFGVKTNPVAPMPAEPRLAPAAACHKDTEATLDATATALGGMSLGGEDMGPVGASLGGASWGGAPLGSSTQQQTPCTQLPLGYSLLPQTSGVVGPASVPNLAAPAAGSVMFDPNSALSLMPSMMPVMDPNDPLAQQRMFLMNQYLITMQSMLAQNMQQLSSPGVSMSLPQAASTVYQPGLSSTNFNLGTAAMGRGAAPPSMGLGSSIGMATMGTPNLAGDGSGDGSFTLQGRGRGQSAPRPPPGGLQPQK